MYIAAGCVLCFFFQKMCICSICKTDWPIIPYLLFYKDKEGFVWFGTRNGLSRYDGNSFLTFRPEIGDEVSLADNRIYDLTEDKDGFLWISTTPELYSCYDLQRARFVDYTGCGELRQNYSTVFCRC